MERAIDPLLTIDAKLWADEFMATKQRLGDAEFDHAMMLGWFANAIMRGYDAGRDSMTPTPSHPDAQAQIAALQARAEQAERLVASQAQEIMQRRQTLGDLAQLHQEQSKQLTQRTAELEAAKRERDVWYARYNELSGVKDRQLNDLQAELERVKQALCDADERANEYQKALHDFESERALPLSIELERVRADNKALDKWRADVTVALQRPEGAFFVDVPQHIKDLVAELEAATHTAQTHQALWREACDQRDKAQAELERVRALIKALPKVEGEIEIYTGKNTNQVVVTYKRGVIIGTLYGLDHAKPVAALYKHRQGMEG